MSIQNRKKDHVELTVEGQSAYSFDAGFDRFRLRHNALPELNIDEISTSATLLGRTFSLPVFISSMTGGYSDAQQVNAVIARVCEQFDIPFGVGSQRAMLEDPSQIASFEIVRKVAPKAFIAANIGGAQLIGNLQQSKVNILVNSIEANAIIVHLNPLQELMQPEGDRNFRGILHGIADIVSKSPVPVIVKETGAGITGSVAKKLADYGVKVIDIAGAGGTSWAKVENLRERTSDPLHEFNDWGLSTVYCLQDVVSTRLSDVEIIASGGIRSGFDVVKSLCLGADFTAIAQPAIAAIHQNGEEGLSNLISNWSKVIQYSMILLGTMTISQLNKEHLVEEYPVNNRI
jgi:isopentenyl-diphosphate Delta-isomerase